LFRDSKYTYKKMDNLKIGFIGQGMVGKNMADDFSDRGYEVVRYSLDSEHLVNKEKIKECDVVFIAVPTPTTPEGFDDSILKKEIKLVGSGKIAVIKSTVLPGTTQAIQEENPNIFVLHSPEFLVASNAPENTRKPLRNIIGIPKDGEEYKNKAQFILSILPKASYEKVTSSDTTELIKYVGNNFLYTKVVFMNIMYDLATNIGVNWDEVSEAVSNDPRIGKSHMNPTHASLEGKTSPGRGAGGYCFPKDFEAFLQFYKGKMSDDANGLLVLETLRNKNVELLKQSGKDEEILKGIYNV